MKKTFLSAVFVLAAFCFAYANELGVGYNNGGPSVRFKWDDAVTSELGVKINYTNDAASSVAVTEITLAVAPINLALYRGEFGSVNIGFIFKDHIVYKAGKGTDDTSELTANDYTLDILLPEVELNFPGVKGLKLIGSVGIGTSWGHDKDGKLDTFNMNLFGISLANAGLVYYFDMGTSKTSGASSVVIPEQIPAAKPELTPVATPAATPAVVPVIQPTNEPSTDATVK